MPDRRRWRRPLAALALVAGVGVLVASPVLAADADWGGSAYDDGVESQHGTDNFVISGKLVRTRADSEILNRTIIDAQIAFGFESGTEASYEASCIPDATINASMVRQQSTTGPRSTMTFTIPDNAFTWPCNGRFAMTVTGTTSPPDSYQLRGTIRVAVPPKPVADLTAETGDQPGAVELRWTPLTGSDVKADSMGYRVQRAAPGGDFETIGEVITDNAADSYSDEVPEPGEYRYRVQSLRRGPDSPVPSENTPTTEVVVEGPPSSSTSTPGVTSPPTTRKLTIPSVGRGTNNDSSSPSIPRLGATGPPTTSDTGFNDALDYGDRDVPEPGDELADGGQSVIQTEGGEGAGLLGPVAGAMVLVGWAGHVIYLNRLAKQF